MQQPHTHKKKHHGSLNTIFSTRTYCFSDQLQW